MPSFDIVSEVEKTEVKNAVEQTNKEVSTRFDFKGSDARVEQAELKLTVFADNEFQLNQVQDILNGKLTKRGVDIKCLEVSEKIEKTAERAAGDQRRQRPRGAQQLLHVPGGRTVDDDHIVAAPPGDPRVHPTEDVLQEQKLGDPGSRGGQRVERLAVKQAVGKPAEPQQAG